MKQTLIKYSALSLASALSMLPQTKLHASTDVFVLSSSMSEQYRSVVDAFVSNKILKLKKTEDVILIDDENYQGCVVKGQGSKRKNKVAFKRLYKQLDCSATYSLLKTPIKTGEHSNSFDIAKATEVILRNMNGQSDYQIFFFGTPLYQHNDSNIDFMEGYPSLGHLERKARFLSPFSLDGKSVSDSPINAHVLYPSSAEEGFIRNEIDGAFKHEKKIKYFWADFFKSRGLVMANYNPLKQGVSMASLNISKDKDYEKTRGSVFFIKLGSASKAGWHQPGDSEVLIKNSAGCLDTQKDYMYFLAKPGIPETIFLDEYDADYSASNQLKLKLVTLNSDGLVEVQYLQPSGNDESKQHNIKLKKPSEITGIALYPVDKDDQADVFGGCWDVRKLSVNFK